MKRSIAVLVFFALAGLPTLCLADAPIHLGGFTLGENIEKFRDKLDMESCQKVRYMEYFEEAEIVGIPGFKSGLVGYGNCAYPGQVLRIKLKYADASKKFYEELLRRFKARFGEPDEWRGDPFHIMIAWKWSFVDKENNRISLILQHNTRDEDEKIGNAVKLTLTSKIEEEDACHRKRTTDAGKPASSPKKVSGRDAAPDWNLFVPH